MKKFLALLLVAVLALGLAGAAFASDSDGGHVTPAPEPTPDAGGGSGTPREEVVRVVEVRAPVTVIVLNVSIANIVTAAQLREPIAQAISTIITNTVADIISAIGITGGVSTVQPASNIQVTEEEAYASNQEAIEQSAARLANNPKQRIRQQSVHFLVVCM